jgi:hypothetical protein
MNLLTPTFLALLSCSANGLTLGPKHKHQTAINRRSVLHKISVFGLAGQLAAPIANAIDAQFAEVGQQEKPPNGESPFVKLSNGVQIKDFREGSGTTVGKGSRVELTLKGRLLNLNGVSVCCCDVNVLAIQSQPRKIHTCIISHDLIC